MRRNRLRAKPNKNQLEAVKIFFSKNGTSFDNHYTKAIAPYSLVYSLLTTASDICKDNNMDFTNCIQSYLKEEEIK